MSRRFPGRTRPEDSGAPDDGDELGVEDAAMTLTEHLAELRTRIIRAALGVVLGAVLIVAFYDPVLDFLLRPYQRLCTRRGPEFCDPSLFILDPIEGLSTRLRIATYGGLILAMPLILWQVWRFIVPALHAKEKKYAIPFILSSVTLFLAGATIAYFTVERALEFLISWAGEDVGQVFRVSSYISLVGIMFAAFGVGFLLPVLLVFLQLVGATTPGTLLRAWRYALIGIVVLAAFITPSGDPISLAMLSVPMMILYFASTLIGWLALRRRGPDPA